MVEEVSNQARRPTGLLGRMAGELMAATNRPRNRWLLEQLDLRPGLSGLEFGFGNGEALEAFLARASGGHAVGVDWSDAMQEAALRRNEAAVRAGRLRLLLGDVQDPALDLGGPHDRIWSSNVVQMVENRQALFERLRSALASGGLVATCFQRRRDAPPARVLAPRVADDLRHAGFSIVETRWMPGASEPAFCILARP